MLVSCQRYQKSQAHIQILQAKDHRLAEISLADVKAEGFSTLKEFKEAWIKLYCKGDPQQIVTAYEFRLCSKTDKPSPAKERQRI